MKKKLIVLVLTTAAVSLFAFTACGEGTETESAAVSSAAESNVISETSASLGIYVQDTDNDGVPDKVVDRDGNDLSHLYTLKEDGIYEDETLILPFENIEVYTASEASAVESTEQSEEPNTEAAENTNQAGTQQQQTANNNSGANVNGNTGNSGGSTNTTNNHVNTGNTGGTVQTPVTPKPQNHAPIYRQQYVVDKAAWSEEVPVYTTVEWAMCTTCGADITGNTVAHMKEHALNGENGNWRSEFKQVQTGTKTIYHEEVGHWENVLICNGCTGTH